MKSPFWNGEHMLEKALAEWNRNQPAWKPFKRYEELTASEQSRVDERAEELEFQQLMVDTEDSIRKVDC